jgi:putative transcriptional regulator
MKKLLNVLKPDNQLQPSKGCLLIAEPFIGDPNFNRTVVLLTEHNQDGSVGFILNKKMSIDLHDIISVETSLKIPVYYGGPVSNNTLHFIHKDPMFDKKSLDLGNGVFWGGSFEEIENALKNNNLNHDDFRFFVGYSGWSKGQLLSEINEKTWIVAPLKTEIIFESGNNHLWRKAVNTLGNDYKHIANSPNNPQYN